MTISELEETYEHLHERMLRGELDEEEFKSEVEKLRFEDDLSHQWKIGWYTGKWYRYDGGQWVQGTPVERQLLDQPPAAESPPVRAERQGRRALAYWLAGILVALLLIASAVLIVGWSQDWWAEPTGQPVGLAETSLPESPAAEATAPSSPTSSPQPAVVASDTPSPTATRRPPTPTPSRQAASATPQAAAATATSTATATPAPSPGTQPTSKPAPTAAPALTGRIFFPVYDSKPERRAFDIYAVQLESGKREIIVGQASQPALSPNGKRLAFRSWDRAQRGILVRELTSGNTWVWINFAEAARPSWSPDSQNIVFPSQQESDRRWRIYRSLGLELDLIRRHGGDIFGRMPVWLADGRIAYWECPLNKCGLYTMHSDGTELVQLTLDESDAAPAASPDGSQVAFMSTRNGNWEVYVVSSRSPEGQRGQGVKRLTQNGARDGLPTWSPDGRWLAFVTDRDGAWAVWATRPDGSGQRKLFDLGGPLEGEIAYVTRDDQHGWTWETLAWGP